MVIRITGDKYGIYAFYKDVTTLVAKEEFREKYLKEAERAEIIHVHGSISALFELRRKFGTSKKIILHYLGTDIRGLKGSAADSLPNLFSFVLAVVRRKALGVPIDRKYLNFLAQNLADAVVVATPDLLKLVKNGILVPIPIDTDHFKPDASTRKKSRNALTINTEVTNIGRALDICHKNGIELEVDVYDRTARPIMYRDMPDYLKRYEVYVDIRYINDFLLENLSSTALQALACGLRVLNYKFEYLDRLPIGHDAKAVVSYLSDIYRRKRSFSLYFWSGVFRLGRG